MISLTAPTLKMHWEKASALPTPGFIISHWKYRRHEPWGAGRFSKGAPWFKPFFSLRGGSDEKPDVSAEEQVNQEKALTAWCQKYLLWVSQVSTAARQGAQLFKLENVPELSQSPDDSRSYHEHLAELVIDGEISNETRQRDRLDEYKNQIADHTQQYDPGVFGLAHALFTVL